MSKQDLSKKFLSPEYILYQLFQLTGIDAKALLESKKNVKQKLDKTEEIKVWKEVCKEMNWDLNEFNFDDE